MDPSEKLMPWTPRRLVVCAIHRFVTVSVLSELRLTQSFRSLNQQVRVVLKSFSSSLFSFFVLCSPRRNTRAPHLVPCVLHPYQPVNLPAHPGARPTNGKVQKMDRFPWQELDEVGDLGRFSVKKHRRFFSRFGLLVDRASSARFSHAMARRLGPRRAAPELIDSCGQRGVGPGARFCAHLAFPARDRLVLGSFPALRPNLAKSRSGVESMVTGAVLLVSNPCFSSAGSYQRRE